MRPDTLTGEGAREQLRKSGQYESLGAAFQAARYAAEKIDPAGPHSRGAEYFASNPKQQLRAWFRHDGIELASGRRAKDENAEPWSVAVRLRASGRAGATVEAGLRTVRAEGGRVEMSDPGGAMTEWYENGRDGLEQGFTFAKPPPGAGPLEIVLAAEGTARPEPLPGVEGGIRFVQSDGAPVVHYAGLKAWDTKGRALPARMELRGSELALLVVDAGARYPVTVDPLFANVEARLTEESVVGDRFGASLAFNGDTALVGAPNDDTSAGNDAGSAYVFVRSGVTWSPQAKLTASDGARDDLFGFSVGLSGDTALIGAPVGNGNAGVNTGSAYVFVRAGADWSQQQELMAPDGEADDFFGYSVALSGDTALAGAIGDEVPAGPANAGSASVFVRSGTSWTPQGPKLTIQNPDSQDQFGFSVALSGDTALVGAHKDDSPVFNAGSAYVFVRDNDQWTQQQQLFGDGKESSLFGSSVALSGNTALIGAPSDDPPFQTGLGSAYVFVRSGAIPTWNLEQKLLATNSAVQDHFGASVALSGDTALVGASRGDTTAAVDSGSAYMFVRNGSSWNPQQKLSASDGAAADSFGSAVAISGDTALVGVPDDEIGVDENAGSTRIFVRSTTVPVLWIEQVPLLARDSAQRNALSNSVALAGDTAIVGAPNDDPPTGVDAGSAFVFVRSDDIGWRMQAKLAASDGMAGDLFGISVKLSGIRALIGAAGSDGISMADSGSAYVFSRSGASWSQQAKLTDPNPAAFDQFGYSVALEGDTALVGAPYDDRAGLNAGSALVFLRTGISWQSQPKLFAGDPLEYDVFGYSVALSGNTALIGAPYYGPLFTQPGKAYVFVSTQAGWAQERKLVASDAGVPALAADFSASPSPTIGPGFAVAGIPGKPGLLGSVYHNPADQMQLGGPVSGHTLGFLQAFATPTNLRAIYDALLRAYGGGDAAPIAQFLRTDGITLNPLAYASIPLRTTVLRMTGFLRVTAPGSYTFTLNSDDASFLLICGYVAISIPGAQGHVPTPGTVTFLAAGLYPIEILYSNQDNTNRAGTYSDNLDSLSPNVSTVQTVVPALGAFSKRDEFGASVSISGNTALVGAPYADTTAGINAGSAYVYVRGNGATWDEEARLTASDGSPSDLFGFAVAVAGDISVAGAPYGDALGGQSDAGRAYVFARQEANWVAQAKLTAGVDSSTNDHFGSAAALSANRALIGAPQDDTTGDRAGSAYVFLLGELPEIIRQPDSQTVVPGVVVTFSVTAAGYAPLRYQWRRNGFEIAGANGSSLAVQVPAQSPFDAAEGTYDVVVSNIGGVVTSVPAVLGVNALSELRPQLPPVSDPRPAAQGFLTVNLSPGGLAGTGWRFVGEQQWRVPGVPVGGLAPGNRQIEYRPLPGYLQPLREPDNFVSGQAARLIEREYFPSSDPGTGSLNVTLLPVLLGSVAQWRLLGEGNDAWRDSGATRGSIVAGVYLVECKDVTGYATPQPVSVRVAAGVNPPLTVTYFVKDAAVGAQPGVVGFDAITAPGPNPHTFVGQLRSDSGAGTGFVVRRRVVATAAHVVFDDGTLSAAIGLQWLFQRERGTYEPVPQIPRGSYILSGYSAARDPKTTPNVTPGASSPESQNLDAAAVWFFEEDAARGGFGGYLASDAANNEWLVSDRLKTLVGYPLDDIPPANQGRMHATPPANITFKHAAGRVYLTGGITSRGGNSGGPVCVRYDDGNYFPAAIYLGGTTQTLVRVIDSEVIALFNSAEESGNTGQNSTNGGVLQLNPLSSVLAPATLTVSIEPAAARAAGAGWRIGSGGFLASGQSMPFLSPGGYTVSSKSIVGFVTPDPVTVNLTPGSPPVVITYALAALPAITTESKTLRAIRDRELPVFRVEASGGPTRFQASGLEGTNLIFDPVSGQLSGIPNANGTFVMSVIAENNLGSSAPVQFTIIVSDPRKLIVQADAARGEVKVRPKRAGNVFPQGEKVTLTAEPDRPAFLFAGWTFEGATPNSLTNPTTHFRMGDEAIVVAAVNFVPNPFLPRSGSHAGLLTNAGSPAGSATVSLRDTGTFTLKLVMGHIRYSLAGSFDLQGGFSGRIDRPGNSSIDVTLHLDLAAEGVSTITGTIHADGIAHELAAMRAGFAPPPAGKFTLTLPPDATQTDAASYPQGFGYALVEVKATGKVARAMGKLGDGQNFSVGGRFTDDARWAIYTQPYAHRKTGLLGGELVFHPATAPAIDTLDGTLTWTKPASPKGRYTAGFSGSIAAEGSRFDPSQVAALGINGWNLNIIASPLPAPLSGTATLGGDGRFTIGGAAAGAVTLKLDSATGLIKGTASVGSGVGSSVKGVLLPSQRQGRGILLLPDSIGPLTLDPPQP